MIHRLRKALLFLALLPLAYATLAFAQVEAPPIVNDKIVGVGLVLSSNNGSVSVAELVPNAPGDKSGLIHQGDRILAVAEGEEPALSVGGKALTDVVSLVRGKVGSVVRLTVAPGGADDRDAREVLLTREEIRIVPGGAPDDRGFPPPRAAAPESAPVELVFERLPGGGVDKLSNYRDKIVVLEFWATWSGPCLEAIPEMQRAAAQLHDLQGKVVFLTVSVDRGKEKSIERLSENGWTKTVNGWASREALAPWKVFGLPTTYIIGADGKIVAESGKMTKQTLEEVIKPLLGN